MFEVYKQKFKQADIVKKYIFVNVAVYIIFVLIGVFSVLFNERTLAAGVRSLFEVPASVEVLLHRPWTLFTYMFMHADLMHILWNMLALYVFGRIFLDSFSTRHFVGTYILGGVMGALFFVVAYNVFPYFSNAVDGTWLVGASASVLAIVVAAAVRNPESRVNLLLFGSVKLSTLAIVAVLISVFLLSGNNAGGNFAHLGGAFAGYAIALLLRRGIDLTNVVNRPVDWFRGLFVKRPFKRKKKAKFTYSAGKRNADYDYNARKKADEVAIDKILEKIKKGGYASLSEEEKRQLFNASSKK